MTSQQIIQNTGRTSSKSRLYDIASELDYITDMLSNPPDDVDETYLMDLRERFEQLQLDKEQKLQNIWKVARHHEQTIDNISEEMERLKVLKVRATSSLEWLRTYTAEMTDYQPWKSECGKYKIKVTISERTVPTSDNPLGKAPEAYLRGKTKYEPMLDEIALDIKNKANVPGWTIEKRTNISFK